MPPARLSFHPYGAGNLTSTALPEYRSVRAPPALLGFRIVNLVQPPAAKKGLAATLVLAIGAALVFLALSSAAAPAATVGACPSFRVLHNDRIGPANLPAGSYSVTPAASSGLACSQASAFFTRFLEDYDGVLPTPWRVIAQGTGKASFARGDRAGFSVARTGNEEEESNPSLGKLCAGTYTVNHRTIVGPLAFNKGRYLLYTPPGSLISCRRASVLFTRFLGLPGGRLPFPWQLVNQTATFYKSGHQVRSAFRIEPYAGA